ncbi:MAG: chain length determinant protein EpsF [Aquabacterium sp.]|uniref:chain length determinant protein EpsF n=1 Tax=Aquabacterium sp. TaxID=1872578 RepID=UPI002725311A|nr:chain length determinant protein EpsF [Aquabacterium sp.]MDO9002237.1 chain length determinant protein EpsF [Aquabacterium sp.]
MTFEQLFAILRARWIIASGIFLLVLSSVTAFTLLKAKTYTAVASVVVDIKSPDPIAGVVLSGAASPSFLMTQIDVMTSQRVALKVVADLRLNEVPSLRQNWMDATKGTGDFKGWLADRFRLSLEVHPSRGSNVINVAYTGAEPNFSAAIVNAFIKAYLDVNMQLRTDPAKQYNQFFDTNAKQLREQLQATQSRLSDFQQKEGIVVTDERLDVEMARLNELSSQLVQMQSAVADSISRQAAVNAQGDKTQDVMMNPLVSTLKANLVQQENQLEQLSTKLGDEHPQVRELRNSIADMRRKIELEVRRVSGSFGISNAVNQSREAQIRSSLEAQRSKVLKMKAVRDQASMLQRDADNAQRAYEGVLIRQNNTHLESKALLDNVAALEYATAPSVPSGPRVLNNIALGGVAGIVLALTAALLAERRDRRLRTYGEIEGLTHLPPMGSIPAFKKRLKNSELPQRFRPMPRQVKALA